MKPFVLSASFSDDVTSRPSHYHDCHQIIFVRRGGIEVTVGGKSYTAGAGTLVIISRFEEHAIRITTPEYERYALRISPETDSALNDRQYLFSVFVNRPKPFSHAVDVTSCAQEVEALLGAICREKKTDAPYGETMLNLLLDQLLILLLRTRPALFVSEQNDNLGLVSRIKWEFETDYQKDFSLDAIAKKYSVSTYYLSHIFKEIAGCSVMNYLILCRIAQAKKRLIKTELSIGEIVEQCGFSDCSNFSRIFRKYTGVSPRDFRKRYQK